MCDAIADELQQHAEIPKEEVVSEKTAQTITKFVDRYGVDSSKQLAQIDYSLPEEAEKLDAHHRSIDHRNL
jgi:DNA-directed RNA polymerase subunit H (RpoH/RPB5)